VNFDSWSEELFVGIFELEEATGSTGSDLEKDCAAKGISANEDWLIRFINENKEFGSGTAIAGYFFDLNRAGRDHVTEIKQRRASRTFRGRLKSIQRSDWIAFGALIVSIFALFKGD